jgi:hypothetical protein
VLINVTIIPNINNFLDIGQVYSPAMWNLSPNDKCGLKFAFKIPYKYFKIKLISLTLTPPSYPSCETKNWDGLQSGKLLPGDTQTVQA